MDERDDLIDVLVETPRGSGAKYEWDHDKHALRFDRRLFSATVYPADYGFVDGTRGTDGEALDALVLGQDPTVPGSWMLARPIGVFWIAYEDRREAKVVAVPDADPTWDDVRDIEDLAPHLRDEIAHFFDVYKELEPGRTPEPDGWEGCDAARRVIREARASQ